MVASSIATAVAAIVNQSVVIPNISLLYLPVILMTAIYFGTGPSLVAASVSVIEYDFFLLRPLFTLTIAQAQDVLAFAVFVIVAVLTGQLAARSRERTEAAQRRAMESRALYELGQALTTVHEVKAILLSVTEHIADLFDVDHCAILVPNGAAGLELAAETSKGSRIRRDRTAMSAALYAYRRGTEVTIPDDSLSPEQEPRDIYLPLRTADRSVGVMVVGGHRDGEPLDPDRRRLLTSIAAQAALIIARVQTDAERQRLEVLEESDRLKSALLSAVSHDLRTPLSSIKASATALLLEGPAWSKEQGREFLQAIDHEADRLNRLVGNLLDLSRIEAGALRPALDWYDIREVMDAVQLRTVPHLAGRSFTVDVASEVPLVQIDLVRIEALLANLIDNAMKYTPPGSPIEIHASYDTAVHLAVVDHGPGIAESDRERIFNTFFRLREHGDRDPGIGLGLAICRGVAEAHGGTIDVQETPGGGATFVLTLPVRPLERSSEALA